MKCLVVENICCFYGGRHVKLNDVRNRIRNMAKEIVESSKRLGKFTFVKMTDFLFICEGLDHIRKRQRMPWRVLILLRNISEGKEELYGCKGCRGKFNAMVSEDFYQYYDKRLKVVEAAGIWAEPVKKSIEVRR